MALTLRRVKGDIDKTHKIVREDGEILGEIFRGWLRSGGKQWCIMLKSQSALAACGAPTLARALHRVQRELYPTA